MFLDLVGSTEMAERQEPEGVRDVLQSYRDSCTAVIRRRDGYVAQFAGDGILAYFGYPRAREDDARRAVIAGLDIIDVVDELAIAVRRDHSVDLAVRVGIHTGLVLISNVTNPETLARDAIFGAAPNQAARIQALAPVGAVVISDDTHDIVGRFFDVESLGTPPLKGIDRRVELFRVLGTREPYEADSPSTRAPLAGRVRELGRLRDHWALVDGSARSVRPCSIVVVAGEPGVGKSRLTETVASELQSGGATLLTAYCNPDHRNNPLWPLGGLVERALGIERTDGDEERRVKAVHACERLRLPVADTMPFLTLALEVAADEYPLPDVEPHALRSRSLDTFAAFIRAHGDTTAAVLVVEDLQWADQTTLALIDRLRAAKGPGRLLVMATTRSVAPTELDGVADEVIALRPLGARDHRAMIDSLAQIYEFPRDVSDLIAARSDGNPLFTEELAKAVARAEDPRDAARTIPSTIRDLLTARLDALGDSKQLAQLAAVVGRDVDVGLLLDASGLTSRELTAGLNELVRAGVLEVTPSLSTTYRFVHALVRDAAYESQDQLHDRQQAHLRVAEALRGRGAVDLGLLAQHLDAAGAAVDAVASYLGAGLTAQASGADIEAIRYFDRALGLLPSVPEESDPDVQEINIRILRGLSLGNVYGFASHAVADDYARALAISQEVGATSDVSLASSGVWAHYTLQGDLVSSAAALQTLVATSPPEFQPEVQACIGCQRFFEGKFGEARRALELAVEAFSRRPGGGEVLPAWRGQDIYTLAILYLAVTQWIVGRTALGWETLERAWERAQHLSPPIGQFARGYVSLYMVWLANAEERFDRASELAERAPTAHSSDANVWVPAARFHTTVTAWHRGTVADPLPALGAAIDDWRDAGMEVFIPCFRTLRAQIELELDDVQSALRDVDDALVQAHRTRECLFAAETRRTKARILLRDGQEADTVRAELVEARNLAAEQGALVFELRAAVDLNALPPTMRKPEDRAALERVLDRCPSDMKLPELETARALLSA